MSFQKPYTKRPRVFPEPIPLHLRRNAVMARLDVPAKPQPKEDAARSEPFRRLVAMMDCIHCGKKNRSQHAHTNAGKGKGIKNDDRDAIPLCADEPGQEGCHTKFDQYRLIPGGREAHVEQGKEWAAQTRAAIEASGLWPKNLPRWTA